MPTEAILIGGPQDGARIKCGGDVLPWRVHVGPKWLGDGYSAWSREASRRFPARYEYDGRASFRFARWQTAPDPELPVPEPCRG